MISTTSKTSMFSPSFMQADANANANANQEAQVHAAPTVCVTHTVVVVAIGGVVATAVFPPASASAGRVTLVLPPVLVLVPVPTSAPTSDTGIESPSPPATDRKGAEAALEESTRTAKYVSVTRGCGSGPVPGGGNGSPDIGAEPYSTHLAPVSPTMLRSGGELAPAPAPAAVSSGLSMPALSSTVPFTKTTPAHSSPWASQYAIHVVNVNVEVKFDAVFCSPISAKRAGRGATCVSEVVCVRL